MEDFIKDINALSEEERIDKLDKLVSEALQMKLNIVHCDVGMLVVDKALSKLHQEAKEENKVVDKEAESELLKKNEWYKETLIKNCNEFIETMNMVDAMRLSIKSTDKLYYTTTLFIGELYDFTEDAREMLEKY